MRVALRDCPPRLKCPECGAEEVTVFATVPVRPVDGGRYAEVVGDVSVDKDLSTARCANEACLYTGQLREF